MITAMFTSLRPGVSNSKCLEDRMRLKLKNEEIFKLISNVFEKIDQLAQFSFKISIFPDVRGPHWTLSRAACLRPMT